MKSGTAGKAEVEAVAEEPDPHGEDDVKVEEACSGPQDIGGHEDKKSEG
jgi:hypothetical protein